MVMVWPMELPGNTLANYSLIARQKMLAATIGDLDYLLRQVERISLIALLFFGLPLPRRVLNTIFLKVKWEKCHYPLKLTSKLHFQFMKSLEWRLLLLSLLGPRFQLLLPSP
ncbi:MAG: hypothetical protein EBR82_57575 [Caulobacteraceae bacterium]|nr:hypothetical protein [Caulobacteraceae bacterium]